MRLLLRFVERSRALIPHMRLAGDLYAPQEQTIVDAGREWIRRYSDEHPALAAVLADDSLRKRANRTVRRWLAACEWRVGELRRTVAIREQVCGGAATLRLRHV